MISFIQQILQKHHKWIFGILLGIIIVAFVFTIGAAPGIVGKKKTAIFYGKDLLSQHDMQSIINSTIISALASDRVFYSKEQLDSAVLRRCALLAQTDKLMIPFPNDKLLAEFMKTLPAFRDETGKFLQEKYEQFLTICDKHGFSKQEIRLTLSDDQRINILSKAIAGDGYVFDSQLEEVLTVFYSKYDIITSTLDYSSFEFNEKISEEEIKAFYDEHVGRYSMPEMIAVSIVKFAADKFIKNVIVPDDNILENYFNSKKDLFKDFSDFKNAKESVAQHYLADEAQNLANKYADEFSCALYDKDIKLNSDQFKELLNKFDVTKEKVAAYSKLKLPVVTGVPEAAFLEICDIDSSRYYSDPFLTDFGAAILLIEGRKNSRILTFEEARSYIEKDVYEKKKREHFDSFVENLKLELSKIKSESGISTKLSEYGMTHEVYQNISLSVDPNKIPNNYWNILSSLPSEENVGLVQNENNMSFIILLKKETPPVEDMLKLNDDDFRKRLLMIDREFSLSEYTNWLVEEEFQKIK